MAWGISIGTSQSENPGANQSTVSATLYLTWNNRDAYSGYNFNCSINIGGNVRTVQMPTAFFAPTQTGSVAVNSHSVPYNHDAAGFRGAVGTSGNIAGPGGFAPGNISVGGTTYGAIDYSRPAGNVPFVSASNVSNVISVSWGQAPAPFGPVTYYWQVRSSSNGGATWGGWSGETATTSLSTSGTYSPGLTYQFRVRAANSDGGGGYTESNTVFLNAGGKRWTGSNWALTTTAAKRFTGSAWVDLTTAKRWNGSSWVNLS
jgi:hypothetical protein